MNPTQFLQPLYIMRLWTQEVASMEGKFGVDGWYWPKHKVLQQLADRRSGVSLFFRIKLLLKIVPERRVNHD